MNINDEIMQLIIRNLSRESSGADDLRLQAWLAESPENRKEFEKIQRVWNTSGQALSQRIDVDHEWEKFKARNFTQKKAEPKVIRFPMNRIVSYAVAAGILIGLFIGIQYLFSGQTYSTGSGQRLLVSLEDGSEVILGENSSLKVARSFNRTVREVELDGEGFFTVAKDPAKPFEIDGPLTTTRVLGTAFQLVAKKNENFINVSEGKVAFWSDKNQDTLILTIGEKGALMNDELMEEEITTSSFDSWKTGIFLFENEPVTSVLQHLQDYYVFNISNLQQFENVNCRFTGKFENQDLQEVLDELALIMGMEYTLKDSTMHISKFYCD